jgi:hypothetical protein
MGEVPARIKHNAHHCNTTRYKPITKGLIYSWIPCRNHFTHIFIETGDNVWRDLLKFHGVFAISGDFFSDQSHISEYVLWLFLLRLKSNNRLEHVKMSFHPNRLFP